MIFETFVDYELTMKYSRIKNLYWTRRGLSLQRTESKERQKMSFLSPFENETLGYLYNFSFIGDKTANKPFE